MKIPTNIPRISVPQNHSGKKTITNFKDEIGKLYNGHVDSTSNFSDTTKKGVAQILEHARKDEVAGGYKFDNFSANESQLIDPKQVEGEFITLIEKAAHLIAEIADSDLDKNVKTELLINLGSFLDAELTDIAKLKAFVTQNVAPNLMEDYTNKLTVIEKSLQQSQGQNQIELDKLDNSLFLYKVADGNNIKNVKVGLFGAVVSDKNYKPVSMYQSQAYMNLLTPDSKEKLTLDISRVDLSKEDATQKFNKSASELFISNSQSKLTQSQPIHSGNAISTESAELSVINSAPIMTSSAQSPIATPILVNGEVTGLKFGDMVECNMKKVKHSSNSCLVNSANGMSAAKAEIENAQLAKIRISDLNKNQNELNEHEKESMVKYLQEYDYVGYNLRKEYFKPALVKEVMERIVERGVYEKKFDNYRNALIDEFKNNTVATNFYENAKIAKNVTELAKCYTDFVTNTECMLGTELDFLVISQSQKKDVLVFSVSEDKKAVNCYLYKQDSSKVKQLTDKSEIQKLLKDENIVSIISPKKGYFEILQLSNNLLNENTKQSLDEVQSTEGSISSDRVEDEDEFFSIDDDNQGYFEDNDEFSIIAGDHNVHDTKSIVEVNEVDVKSITKQPADTITKFDILRSEAKQQSANCIKLLKDVLDDHIAEKSKELISSANSKLKPTDFEKLATRLEVYSQICKELEYKLIKDQPKLLKLESKELEKQLNEISDKLAIKIVKEIANGKINSTFLANIEATPSRIVSFDKSSEVATTKASQTSLSPLLVKNLKDKLYNELTEPNLGTTFSNSRESKTVVSQNSLTTETSKNLTVKEAALKQSNQVTSSVKPVDTGKVIKEVPKTIIASPVSVTQTSTKLNGAEIVVADAGNKKITMNSPHSNSSAVAEVDTNAKESPVEVVAKERQQEIANLFKTSQGINKSLNTFINNQVKQIPGENERRENCITAAIFLHEMLSIFPPENTDELKNSALAGLGELIKYRSTLGDVDVFDVLNEHLKVLFKQDRKVLEIRGFKKDWSSIAEFCRNRITDLIHTNLKTEVGVAKFYEKKSESPLLAGFIDEQLKNVKNLPTSKAGENNGTTIKSDEKKTLEAAPTNSSGGILGFFKKWF